MGERGGVGKGVTKEIVRVEDWWCGIVRWHGWWMGGRGVAWETE